MIGGWLGPRPSDSAHIIKGLSPGIENRTAISVRHSSRQCIMLRYNFATNIADSDPTWGLKGIMRRDKSWREVQSSGREGRRCSGSTTLPWSVTFITSTVYVNETTELTGEAHMTSPPVVASPATLPACATVTEWCNQKYSILPGVPQLSSLGNVLGFKGPSTSTLLVTKKSPVIAPNGDLQVGNLFGLPQPTQVVQNSAAQSVISSSITPAESPGSVAAVTAIRGSEDQPAHTIKPGESNSNQATRKSSSTPSGDLTRISAPDFNPSDVSEEQMIQLHHAGPAYWQRKGWKRTGSNPRSEHQAARIKPPL